MKVFDKVKEKTPDWHKQTPYQIKKIACEDACKAIKKVRSNRKGKTKSTPKYRSKRDYVSTIYIPKSAVNDKGAYYTLLGELKAKEFIPRPDKDCRLEIFYGDYYLIIPVKTTIVQSENQARIVAVDTGVRNFIGYFAEDGCGIIGENAFLPVYKVCLKMDELKSKMTKVCCRRRYNFKKAYRRLSGRIKYMVDELHKKTAKFLLDNYDIILLPEFNVSEMVKKTSERILNNKTVRRMLSLSHYKFKQFLKFKAALLGKRVLDVNEAYTTKTVSWTGEMLNVGGSKVIKSPSTGEKMNRDINAPRGIFIKTLVDTPALTQWVKIMTVNNTQLC